MRLGDSEKSEQVFPKALEFHTKMFEMVRKMQNIQPKNNVTMKYLSSAFTNMVISLSANKKFEKAWEMAEENLELINKNLASDKSNKETKFDLSLAYDIFSDIYFRQKDCKKIGRIRIKNLGN